MNCLQLTCQITGTFSVFTTAANLDDRLWLSMITDSDYRPVLIVCWGGSVESCTVGIQTVSERGSRSSRGQQTQTRGWPPAWLSLSLPAHLFRTAARKINFISSVSLPAWPKHPEPKQCLQCFPEWPETFISLLSFLTTFVDDNILAPSSVLYIFKRFWEQLLIIFEDRFIKQELPCFFLFRHEDEDGFIYRLLIRLSSFISMAWPSFQYFNL